MTAPEIIAYARVSTRRQGDDGNGLTVQAGILERYAAHHYPDHKTTYIEDVCKGMIPLADRPVLGPALARLCDPGDPAGVLMVAAPDRLARDALEVLTLVLRVAKQNGFTVVFCNLAADVSTSAGFTTVGVHAVLGHADRMRIIERTAAGRDAAMSRGVQFGPPVQLAADTRRRIVCLRDVEGLTYSAIVDRLVDSDTPTATGRGSWSITAVRRAYLRATADGIAADA